MVERAVVDSVHATPDFAPQPEGPGIPADLAAEPLAGAVESSRRRVEVEDRQVRRGGVERIGAGFLDRARGPGHAQPEVAQDEAVLRRGERDHADATCDLLALVRVDHSAPVAVEIARLIAEDSVEELPVHHCADVAGGHEAVAQRALVEVEVAIGRRLLLPERLLELPDAERKLGVAAPSHVGVLEGAGHGVAVPRWEVQLEAEVEVLVDGAREFRARLADEPGVRGAADVVLGPVGDDAVMDPDVAAEGRVKVAVGRLEVDAVLESCRNERLGRHLRLGFLRLGLRRILLLRFVLGEGRQSRNRQRQHHHRFNHESRAHKSLAFVPILFPSRRNRACPGGS